MTLSSFPAIGDEAPQAIVLGVAQDGGYPHAGCKRECCQAAWQKPELARRVVCLAVVDPESKERWLFECTPDFAAQLQYLDELFSTKTKPGIAGILLTHAHVGHYTGLMQLGREVMGTRNVDVYAMPRLKEFLQENGPWSQLVALSNIHLRSLSAGEATQLNPKLKVTPITVPHRDEFSETVGFIVRGPNHGLFFLPDIDKWQLWDHSIEDVIASVDRAYLDGTFYANGEVPGRDMSEIPHPFISESMERFAKLPESERNKIHFIHLNHTNPALQVGSAAHAEIKAAGYHVAAEGDVFEL